MIRLVRVLDALATAAILAGLVFFGSAAASAVGINLPASMDMNIEVSSSSSSSTSNESLCVMGYLPDGTWFDCQ